eukprot:3941316-Rhodomonas_salina.4
MDSEDEPELGNLTLHCHPKKTEANAVLQVAMVDLTEPEESAGTSEQVESKASNHDIKHNISRSSAGARWPGATCTGLGGSWLFLSMQLVATLNWQANAASQALAAAARLMNAELVHDIYAGVQLGGQQPEAHCTGKSHHWSLLAS